MNMKETLNTLQNMCDSLYGEYGAINDIIQLQVAINSLRNTFDIPDETKLTESNKGFVQ